MAGKAQVEVISCLGCPAETQVVPSFDLALVEMRVPRGLSDFTKLQLDFPNH